MKKTRVAIVMQRNNRQFRIIDGKTYEVLHESGVYKNSINAREGFVKLLNTNVHWTPYTIVYI